MRHLDLFSGIGGFALAASWVWPEHEVVAFCDNEPFCRQVLKKHWPDVPVVDDIRKIKGKDYGTVDLVTGGFPCQPFSGAGKRGGEADDRYLWPEMLRVISEIRPTWIIGENVAGIINMALDTVCADLENEGYAVQPLIVPACAVNAPHRRDRVWVVAHSKRYRVRRPRGVQRQVENLKKMGKAPTFAVSANSDASNPGNTGLQGSERFGSHGQGQAAHGSTPECNHAWDEPWIEAATRLCGMDARIPRRVDRLKSLGNAIVPQVAAAIMQAIKEVDAGERRR